MLHQLKDSEYHLDLIQIRKLIQKAGTFRDACLIKTFAQTGIRRAELASLDITDIDFDQKLLHIRNGKGGKARIVPLTEELASDLKHITGSLSVGPIFPSKNGFFLTLRQVNWIVTKVGKSAGVKNPNPKYKNITCHLFRHSFAREWKRRQGSIETLSKILGHASVKTTLDEYGTEGLTDVRDNYSKVMKKIWSGGENLLDK